MELWTSQNVHRNELGEVDTIAIYLHIGCICKINIGAYVNSEKYKNLTK